MTSITSQTGPSTTPFADGAQEVQVSATPQGVSAAGAVSGMTAHVPAEVGQAETACTATAGKPALSEPKHRRAAARRDAARAEEAHVGTARQKADVALDRAALLREMRKDRREAVCAKAFELQDFARLVVGPAQYCLRHPIKVVTAALAVSAATALAISTGNLAGFKAAMPGVSAVIGGMIGSSGVDEMLQRGSELALLQLGVDPKVTEKWGDAVGSAVFVGANVAMNAIGGTWQKIDFSSMGELAGDVAVLLNVPAKNAAALSALVGMVGTGVVGIGAGIVAGDYKELSSANFEKVWITLTQKLQGRDFDFTDITNMNAFKAMQKAWGALVADFGDLETFVQKLNEVITPGNDHSKYKA